MTVEQAVEQILASGLNFDRFVAPFSVVESPDGAYWEGEYGAVREALKGAVMEAAAYPDRSYTLFDAEGELVYQIAAAS